MIMIMMMIMKKFNTLFCLILMTMIMSPGQVIASTNSDDQFTSHKPEGHIDLMIRIALGIGSTLSLLVSLTILFLFLRWKELRTTQNRMVAYMTVSNTMAALIILVTAIVPSSLKKTESKDAGISENILGYLMSNNRWLLAGNFASSASWSLALPVNLCAVVFGKVHPEKLQKLEMIYNIMFFFVPMGIYALDGSIGMSWGFFTYIWFIFVAHSIMYLLLGSKIWWTKGNTPAQGHGRYLQTTLSLVAVYGILWFFPTLHFLAEQKSEVAKYLNVLFSEYYICMLASLALGSYGLWTGFFYLRWTVDSIASVKRYIRDRQFFQNQHECEEERAPLLFPQTHHHQDVPLNNIGTPRILGASAADGGNIFVGRKFAVLYEYEPRREDEIFLRPGETVLILAAPEGGWWRGTVLKVGGKTGWFPANYVTLTSLSQLADDDDDEEADGEVETELDSLIVGSPFDLDSSSLQLPNPFLFVTNVNSSDSITLADQDSHSSSHIDINDNFLTAATELDSLATSYCSSFLSNPPESSGFGMKSQDHLLLFHNHDTGRDSDHATTRIEGNGSIRGSRRNSYLSQTNSDYIHLL